MQGNKPDTMVFVAVQSLAGRGVFSRVHFFVTPWTAACQASLSITNSHSLLKLMSTESMTPPNHLILRHPLPLLLSIFPIGMIISGSTMLMQTALFHSFLFLSSLRWWWWFSHSVMSNSQDPMDYIQAGSSVRGILQARTLEWVAIT